jgi:ABC-type methionine transport system permease subunit
MCFTFCKMKATIFGLIGGILVAPLALFLAVISGGAGHGHYVAARLLFPFTMASTYVFEAISPPFIVLAILQYPIYGLLVGRAAIGRQARKIAWTLGALHLLLAAILFIAPNHHFH